jgi:DNA-3-methyladenine glycosylase II
VPALRRAGLSVQKAGYLQDLAEGFLDGRIAPRAFARQSNEEIVAALVSIRGIGQWTAEMFLIFSLNRLNVLPVDDLGIRKAIRRWYGFKSLPAAKTVRQVGKSWIPYETVACWYLWQSLRLTGPAGIT